MHTWVEGVRGVIVVRSPRNATCDLVAFGREGIECEREKGGNEYKVVLKEEWLRD